MDYDGEVVRLLPWLRSLARRYCSDRMDIDDLVGETVCKALCNRDKYDGKKAIKPWLEAIMQNTYITGYNRCKVVQFVRTDVSWTAAGEGGAGDSVAMRDLREVIARCRKKSRCVESFIRYMEGYSYEEIGRMYGIPTGTVRSRISSARTMIRNELDFKS